MTKFVPNIFSKKQPRALIVTFIGILIMAIFIAVIFFIVNKDGKIEDGQFFPMFLGIIVGFVLSIQYPVRLSNRRKCVKEMKKHGITDNDIIDFNKEAETIFESFAAYTKYGGSTVSLTDNWIYELDGKRSALFRISEITLIHKDIEYYSINGVPEATHIRVKTDFKDGRSVLIRVKRLKPSESESLGDNEVARIIEYLSKRCPDAQIGIK